LSNEWGSVIGGTSVRNSRVKERILMLMDKVLPYSHSSLFSPLGGERERRNKKCLRPLFGTWKKERESLVWVSWRIVYRSNNMKNIVCPMSGRDLKM
jgi:hypothetical protein